MSKDFCLLDEPWLPVRLADGRVVELGLLEAFRRSGEITALAETTPTSLVAEYRLLLAIVHRAMARAFERDSKGRDLAWENSDRALWYREGLPVGKICAYLEYWRERFWLFHPQYPFMQVAALATCDETQQTFPLSAISIEQCFGTSIFNQEVFQTCAWKPAAIIRSMLGYMQYVPGGFFPGKKLKGSDRAGALVNTAAVLPVGKTLAQTLCLCLHPAPTGNREPDLPAWEREPLTIQELRGDSVLATGPNDRYTRQSRAVLLLREGNGAIRWLRFAAGWALGEDANAPDPMASFRVDSKGMVRLGFTEGRAFWRDLPAMVPNPSGTGQHAAVLDHAINLHQESSFDEIYQPLLVAGLASYQAKLLRWRIEQITLPSALLVDSEKALHLQELMALAEELFKALKSVAVSMLAEIMPEPSRKDTRNRARGLLGKSAFEASYFSFAERALPELLLLLGQGENERAETLWRVTLRKAAHFTWKQIQKDMGYSARALRADAKFLPRFYGALNKHIPESPESMISKEA
ncbi:MAG: type I-E CRISPR-associated protein Cse1/CasA [Azoarcus sp.]|jgi:CRISPR system Cascade subunit CasA|nr:type I-E CRISPR-associated protein Cse1/CasA [Azoarcus sp.]